MRIRRLDACEPWGYVAPVVAAVMTRATRVRHIYLIIREVNSSLTIDLLEMAVSQTHAFRGYGLRGSLS